MRRPNWRLFYSKPPGGATALTAVFGGAALRKLGFNYMLVPVGINVAVMLAVAVVFNYRFAWRRYPAALGAPKESRGPLSRDDWSFALGKMGSLVDVPEDELVELHEFASQHAAIGRRPVAFACDAFGLKPRPTTVPSGNKID